MVLAKLALLTLSLSVASAVSSAKPIELYVDISGMQALMEVYPYSGSTIPLALQKSIGNCKFYRPTVRPQADRVTGRLNGQFSNFTISSGTSKQNDTCLQFFDGWNHFVPWKSLVCDADGYVSLKDKPSGTCIFDGVKVNAGKITLGTLEFTVLDRHQMNRAYWQKTAIPTKYRDIRALDAFPEIFGNNSKVPAVISKTLSDCKFFSKLLTINKHRTSK